MPLTMLCYDSLDGNSVGGYNDEGDFVSNMTGMIKLSEALKKNETIKSIRQANIKNIRSQAPKLSPATDNITLPSLHGSLAGNHLKSEGAGRLADVLKDNKTLTSIKYDACSNLI